MNPNIAILLDLRTLDVERRKMRTGREEKLGALAKAEQNAAMARTSADAAQTETKRHDALVRQYQSDVERCEAKISELRAQQPAAKTNREYMAIINGIEVARAEKAQREQSIKEINANLATISSKAQALATKADELAARRDQIKAAADAAAQPGPEEAELQVRYDARKEGCEPTFLEAYERMAKANHPRPLVRVDPATRATPYGQILSHNQIELIRLGKLVIDRTSNSILYLE